MSEEESTNECPVCGIEYRRCGHRPNMSASTEGVLIGDYVSDSDLVSVLRNAVEDPYDHLDKLAAAVNQRFEWYAQQLQLYEARQAAHIERENKLKTELELLKMCLAAKDARQDREAKETDSQ